MVDGCMKKLFLLLFSLMLSFNSFAEWTKFPSEGDEVAYIDFDNLQEKSDGYVYWWMMLSDSLISGKYYFQTDCEFERINPLQQDIHTEPMGGGDAISLHPDEGWTYVAPDTALYRFISIVCEMADETPEQRAKSIENLLMSLEYKSKINDLYEEELEKEENKGFLEEELYRLNELEAVRAKFQMEFENEQYNRLLIQEVQAEQDQEKLRVIEDQLNTLKSAYVSNIAARVKSFWRYQGAEDDWTAEVYIVQDRDGTVVAVDVRNANVDDSNKAKVFKDSIRRAVYKASPLPSAPDEAVFDKELIFIFGVN
jgi:hypothetical protein